MRKTTPKKLPKVQSLKQMMNELLPNPKSEKIESASFSEGQELATPFGLAVLVSDLGTREYKDQNEDRAGAKLFFKPVPRLGFVVLDGMGGSPEHWDRGLYVQGEKAAEAGLEAALDCLEDNAIERIPDSAYEKLQQRNLNENGFVGCWGEVEFDPEGNVVLDLRWVGDVEAYIFRGDQFIPLTEVQRSYRNGVDYLANYVSGERSAVPAQTNVVLLPGDELFVYTDGVGDNLTPTEIKLLTQERSMIDSIKILDVALRLKMERGLPSDVYQKTVGLSVEDTIALLESSVDKKGSKKGKPDNRTFFRLKVAQPQT